MSDYKFPKRGLMLDIETLALGTRPVILQIGGIFFDFDDITTELQVVDLMLPAQPQLEMIPPRTVQMSTITWWFQNEPAAKTLFSDLDGDLDELDAYLRMLARNFAGQMTGVGDDYEVWARGPQFDIAAIESLMVERGIPVPWRYDRVRDLRTIMATAGINTADVPRLEGQIDHNAVWDSRYQIRCLAAALARVRPA